MKVKEVTGHKWTAAVTIQNPYYTGRIDVSVYAHNQAQARQLIKAQYGVEHHHIGSIRRSR